MSHIKLWYVNNDMVIEIADVIDTITGDSIDDATIEATLKDSDGNDVAGISWPQTINFISAGLYRKTIDKAAAVLDGGGYTLEITLTTPGGADAFWDISVGGEKRTT